MGESLQPVTSIYELWLETSRVMAVGGLPLRVVESGVTGAW